MAEAIARVGLANTAKVSFEPARHIGYLEAHIEQGPHLEETGLTIGAVTSIVGIRGFEITFTANRTMQARRRWLAAKMRVLQCLSLQRGLGETIAEVASPTTVWTFGEASVEPGAPSIIPGKAKLVLQFLRCR